MCNCEIEKEVPNSMINMDILPNEIHYSWQELNCFYRPIAIAFRSYHTEYFDLILFLESFIRLYCYDNLNENYHNDFFEFYEEEFACIFDVHVNRIEIKDTSQFHNIIVTECSKGAIVVSPGDLYALFYSAVYKQNHHNHYFLIKGYDLEKKIYYILDNSHLNFGASMKYEDFRAQFDDIIRLNDAYIDNYVYDKNAYNFIWSINGKGDNHNFMFEFLHWLRNFFHKLEHDKRKVCCLEYNLLSEFQKNGCIDNIDKKLKLLNTKVVFYDMLLLLLNEMQVEESILEEIKQYIQSIQTEWHKIKNVMLYMFERKKSVPNIETLILNNKNKEFELFMKVNTVLRTCDITKFINNNSNAVQIKNNNNAQYSCKDDCIKVYHSKNYVYDTWVTQDNAFQILYSVNEKEYSCEVSLYTDSEVGKTFHFGIIIKCKDGTKYLFGNEQNKIVSLYHTISQGENTLFTKEYMKLPKMSIKIQNRNGDLQFFAKEEHLQTWENIYEVKNIGEVNRIGLFSKTWEYIDHISEFTEYKFHVDSMEKVELLL